MDSIDDTDWHGTGLFDNFSPESHRTPPDDLKLRLEPLLLVEIMIGLDH